MDQDNLEKVPRGMMDELNHAGDEIQPHELNTILMNTNFSLHTPLIQDWYLHSNEENRSKEIKLIKHIWLHEPQFKAEKPKKFIIRAVDKGNNPVYVVDSFGILCPATYQKFLAYRFDTREEALKYVTPQCQVVEVEE